MTDYVYRWTEFAVGRGMRLLTILIVAMVLNRLLRSLTRRLVRAAGAEATGRVARMREQQTQTFAGVLYSGGTAIIVIVAALTALPEFGFNVTPVAAADGLASLALGFGAQHVVRDFINGFFTVFEDQYVVGDTVRIGERLF
jgi:small-conductance mechanosensitive channel